MGVSRTIDFPFGKQVRLKAVSEGLARLKDETSIGAKIAEGCEEWRC